jgi:uncharacterized membrane protein
VLDLRAPDDDSLASLLKLWPAFASYIISFIFAAIYWINHHDLLSTAKRVTPALIWSNNALLFFLSLFPFATAYMSATHISSFATMIYGAVQFCCSLCFGLVSVIIQGQHEGEVVWRNALRPRSLKARVSTALYALAIPAAYLSPMISIAIFAAVALVYIAPDFLIRGEAPDKPH